MVSLRTAFARFTRSEGGTVMAEAVLVLPFMLWAYLGLFVYWDAYRTINKVQKATYTISDMISREMVTISTTYITGMDTLLEEMIDGNKDASIRVTSVTWSESNKRFEVHWSRVAGTGYTALTTTTLQNLKASIPEMSDGDYVVIVESTVHYTPAFNVGVGEQDIKNFIVTRPRFVPKICLSGVACT